MYFSHQLELFKDSFLLNYSILIKKVKEVYQMNETLVEQTNNSIEEMEELIKQRDKLKEKVKATIPSRQSKIKESLDTLRDFEKSLQKIAEFCKKENLEISHTDPNIFTYTDDYDNMFHYKIYDGIVEISSSISKDGDPKIEENQLIFLTSISKDTMPDIIPTNLDENNIVDENYFLLPQYKRMLKFSDRLISSINDYIKKELEKQIAKESNNVKEALETEYESASIKINAFVESIEKILEFCQKK